MLNSADLVHPLVGAAIAVQILEFETWLNRCIEGRYRADGAWRKHLDCQALKRIDGRYKEAKSKGIEANHAWMYGDIDHKLTILEVDPDLQTLVIGRRNEVFHTRPPTEIQAALKALERVPGQPEGGSIPLIRAFTGF